MLLTVLTDSYFEYLKSERNVSDKTVNSYNSDWQDFYHYLEEIAGYELASLNAEIINHTLVRSYLAYLNKRGLSKSTIARRLSSLRSFFKYLMHKEILIKNPLNYVSTPKLSRKLPRYLEQPEMQRLLDTQKNSSWSDKRNRAILELLYGAGLRVSELVKLDVQSIDFNSGYLKVMGKGSRERILPIGKSAITAILDYIEASSDLFTSSNAALFLNNKKSRLSDRSVRNIVKQKCKIASTKEILSPHGFRHSYASHLLDNGADLRIVQELLGHKKLSSTQIYTHVSRNKLRNIYQKSHPRA